MVDDGYDELKKLCYFRNVASALLPVASQITRLSSG